MKEKIPGKIFLFIFLLLGFFIVVIQPMRQTALPGQYSTWNAKLSDNILEPEQDNVDLSVEWSTVSLPRHYWGSQILVIYVNGEYYKTIGTRNEGGYNIKTVQITNLNPGDNKVTAKLGLQGFFDCSQGVTGSRQCSNANYKYVNVCPDIRELLFSTDCALLNDAIGTGDKIVGSLEVNKVLTYQRDILSEIQGINVVSQDIELFKKESQEPSPTDLCPNLEGLQQTVPDGYEIENGVCIQSTTQTGNSNFQFIATVAITLLIVSLSIGYLRLKNKL